MEKMKKLLLLLLCVLMIQVPVVPASAATVKNGWDSSRTHYYKNSKALTGLQKIGGYYYYFNSKGVVQKNKMKKLTVKNKSYYFYFGKTGAAYRAKANDYYVSFKLYKISGKYYGFDSDSHRVTGIWAADSGNVYYFKSNGIYNAATTKKLRKLAKYQLKSKTLLTDIKNVYGKPKKTTSSKNSCNPFDGYDSKYYIDYVLLYDHVEIQMTKNTKTGVYFMNGVFPREK